MSFFYYPTDRLYYDPEKYFALEPEDVWLEVTTEKLTVHGWLFKTQNKNPKGTFLFFHGNAENLTSHYAMMIWVVKQGYNLFIFDYPGYGQSIGTLNPKNVSAAGAAVTKWAESRSDLAPLVLFGQSLGGNIALRAASEGLNISQYKAIVIDSSFDSYKKIAQDRMQQLWLTWPLQPLAYVLFTDKFAPNFDQLPNLRYLLIHGEADQTVPSFFSDRIAKKINQSVTVWKIEKSSHGRSFSAQNGIYQKKLIDYLDSLN